MGERDDEVLTSSGHVVHCGTGSCTIDPDDHDTVHRTLRHMEDEEFPGRGVGAGATPPYENPVLVYVVKDDAFRRDPEPVHPTDKSRFTATEWETKFSNLFVEPGAGEDIAHSYEKHTMSGFVPVVSETYEVLAHIGWVRGDRVYVPLNTVGQKHPEPNPEQKLIALWKRYADTQPPAPARTRSPARGAVISGVPPGMGDVLSILGRFTEEDRARLNMYMAVLDRKRPKPHDRHEDPQAVRRAVAGTEQEAVNLWVKLGGIAVVGRTAIINETTNWDPCFTDDDVCLVLVTPDGSLNCILKVEPASYAGAMEIIIDIALLLAEWFIPELIILKVGVPLFRAARLVAKVARIRVLKVTLKLKNLGRLRKLEGSLKNLKIVDKPLFDETLAAARGERLKLPELAGKNKDRTAAVGELWEEGKNVPRHYEEISGTPKKLKTPEADRAPQTDLSRPGGHPVHVQDPWAEYPPHVRKMTDADKFKWRDSPEGRKWLEDHQLNKGLGDNPAEEDLQARRVDGHHPGPRDHEAEAKVLEKVKRDTRPDTQGELHLKTTHPMCPACKDLTFRFSEERGGIIVIQH
jgi:hypothetical protein